MKIQALSLFFGLVVCAVFATAQQPAKTPEPPATLGLEHGLAEYDTPSFTIKLVKDSQTLAALMPRID